jgi:PTH1 family peptidyl-tRNA hydrolase
MRSGSDALVVGLGNPGPQYRSTRHNIGFRVVDELRQRWHSSPERDKFRAAFSEAARGVSRVFLLKPMTYMNRSGESVRQALHTLRVPVERLVVVHDELDLPFGAIRVKLGGGLAGHNGLRSIVQQCTSSEFVRIRFGIGRPITSVPTDQYVLGGFGVDEKPHLEALIGRACEMVETVLEEGAATAMNKFNQNPKTQSTPKQK